MIQNGTGVTRKHTHVFIKKNYRRTHYIDSAIMYIIYSIKESMFMARERTTRHAYVVSPEEK